MGRRAGLAWRRRAGRRGRPWSVSGRDCSDARSPARLASFSAHCSVLRAAESAHRLDAFPLSLADPFGVLAVFGADDLVEVSLGEEGLDDEADLSFRSPDRPAGQADKHVEGAVGGPVCSGSGAGRGQEEGADAAGDEECELLSDHSAHADSDDVQRAVPSPIEVIEEGDEVLSHLAGGVGPTGGVAPAYAAVVKDEDGVAGEGGEVGDLFVPGGGRVVEAHG